MLAIAKNFSIAKRKPIQSTLLSTSEKINIPVGTTLNLINAYPSSFNHSEVQIEGKYGIWYLYNPHYTFNLQYEAPCQGRITSYYGRRGNQFHYGIDVANEEGTAIRAIASGVVEFSGFEPGYGNYVVVTHCDNSQSLYAHHQNNAVIKGQKVSKRQVLGYMGSTGYSTGPHLHLEIKLPSREPTNPLNYNSLKFD